MSNKPRLLILEGFDRTGKDHLLQDFKDKHASDPSYEAYVQVIPPTKPDYRTQPDAFREWLIGHIGNQVDDLVRLASSGKTTLMLVRLLLTDVVYSTLFNREQAVNRFHDKVFKTFNVENNVFLFRDYNEYLKRLDIIGDGYVEYSEDEFSKVNELYVTAAKQFEALGAKTKFFYINGDEFLGKFLDEVER